MLEIFGIQVTYAEIFLVVSNLFYVVAFFLSNGKISKRKNNNKGGTFVDSKKFKFVTEQTVQPTVGQTTSKLKPVYRMNTATGELEKTDEVVDLQEVIDSFKDMTYESLVNRLLEGEREHSEAVAAYENMADELDLAMSAVDMANDMRERYNLSSDMPINEVFAYHQKKTVEAYEALKPQAQKEEIKQEVQNDAQKNVEKSE